MYRKDINENTKILLIQSFGFHLTSWDLKFGVIMWLLHLPHFIGNCQNKIGAPVLIEKKDLPCCSRRDVNA